MDNFIADYAFVAMTLRKTIVNERVSTFVDNSTKEVFSIPTTQKIFILEAIAYAHADGDINLGRVFGILLYDAIRDLRLGKSERDACLKRLFDNEFGDRIKTEVLEEDSPEWRFAKRVEITEFKWRNPNEHYPFAKGQIGFILTEKEQTFLKVTEAELLDEGAEKIVLAQIFSIISTSSIIEPASKQLKIEKIDITEEIMKSEFLDIIDNLILDIFAIKVEKWHLSETRELAERALGLIDKFDDIPEGDKAMIVLASIIAGIVN